MNFKKIIQRFLIYSTLSFLFAIGTITIFIYIYEDKIINTFEKEINKHAQTEIRIKTKEISFIESFPSISIHLKNVRIKGSETITEDYLAHFNDLFLDFNLLSLLKGNYAIERVHAFSGGVKIFIDKKGNNNYSFYKNSKDNKKDISFKIKFIELKNIDFIYQNDTINQIYSIEDINGKGKFYVENKKITSHLDAEATVEKIQIGNSAYFSDKKIQIDGLYEHNQSNLNGKLGKTNILINNSKFRVNGEIQPKKDRYFFKINSYKTTINTILSLLPNSIAKSFSNYKSKGEVLFSSKILKKTNDNVPAISALFELKKVNITEPKSKTEINNLSLKGSFSNGKQRNNKTSTIDLKNIKGEINKHSISGKLKITNFDDSKIQSNVIGTLDLNYFSNFINKKSILKINDGIAKIDISINSKISDLQKSNTDNIKSSGIVKLENLQMNYNGEIISDLNGEIRFNNNVFQIDSFKTKIGNSDFDIKGQINNPFSALLYKKKELEVSLQSSSNVIESDSLIKYFFTNKDISESSKKEMKYKISVNSKAGIIKFNQFNFTDYRGHITLHNNLITIPKMKFKEAEGYIQIQSTIDLKEKSNVKIQGIGQFQNIDIKTAFSLFDNFGQEFITSKNLNGKLSTDIKSKFILDDKYEIISESIELKASCLLKEGVLIDFEPMQRMAKFLKRKELDNISFSDLKNTISIKNKVITIPEMDINSSASNIVIKGTHTFDQKINYKVKFPLENFNTPDKDAAFGAIEDDGSSSVVHLKIDGTTDDYKITYDTKATRNKIKSNIKEEFQEIKDIVNGKINSDTIIQTELEDEYFDFE